MANTFKNGIDRMMWGLVPPSPAAHAAGLSVCSDLRNTITRTPHIFQLQSAVALNKYNDILKSWSFIRSPTLQGTFGAGADCVFAPSISLVGNIGAGCTTTSIVTTTVMTANGANSLGNRGGSGDHGYLIRITGKSAGGSGKTEERWITGNTAGTTPTIYLHDALSFVPANGDTYEILSGKVFMLSAGTLAAGMWKSFEIGASTLSGNLATTNLPATVATDSSLVALDEQYVPYDAIPGEGFLQGTSTYDGSAPLNTVKRCLLATATEASSITGQATGGDATVLANEYRNFQIRIVEDTAAPTAVGQRRIIASHTAGASPVYTLGSAWTVTPSANAKFVIEYPNLILLRSSATAVVYTYNYGNASITNGTNTIAADAWSVTYFGNAPAVCGAGVTLLPSFGIRTDSSKVARHSQIYMFRGAAGGVIDVLDIAGAIAGSYETNIAYDGSGPTLTTGSCGAYAPFGEEGRFGYLNLYVASVINQIFRFDVANRTLIPVTPTDFIQSGTAAAGSRLAAYAVFDDTDTYSTVFLLSHLSTIAQELLVLA